MNDLGANVAAILDDNQSSYMNMDDYIDLARVERFHDEREKATFDLSTVLVRDSEEKDFNATWGEGIKMNWDYVPISEQKTHINWRQSINDDGSNLARLASFPCSAVNGTGGGMSASSGLSSIMKQNKDKMDAYSGGSSTEEQNATSAISNGKKEESNSDACANYYKNDCKGKLSTASDKSIDPLLAVTLAYITSSSLDSVVSKLSELQTKLGTTNPAVTVAAYGTKAEVFLGVAAASGSSGTDERSKYGNVPRFDMNVEKAKDTSGGNAKDDGKQDTSEDGLNLNWDGKDSWMWADISKRFTKRAAMLGFDINAMSLFPRVCYLYCATASKCTTSHYDNTDLGLAFPFFEEQFKTGINYSSPFGPRNLGGGEKMHRGIDLGADRGTEIHAIADGTVKEDGTGESWGDWHGICIAHDDGKTYSRYLHCNSMSVSAGSHVSKGDVIGTVGGYGQNGANSYDDHLHFEVCEGDAIGTKSFTDPLDYFPILKAECSKGDALKCEW